MSSINFSNMGGSDYSALFGSLSTNNNNSAAGTSNLLADYASLKNGSYKKLAKAYYQKTEKGTSTEQKDEIKKEIKDNKVLQSGADALKETLDKMTDSKSLFNDKIETTDADGNKKLDYDYDKIKKSLKSFVEEYNKIIDKGAESDQKAVLRNTLNMTKMTSKNSNLLSRVGISIEEGNKLSFDEEEFKNAPITTLRTLFSGTGSYADSVAVMAKNISNAAAYENNKLSNYTANGTYSYNANVGNIYDGSY